MCQRAPFRPNPIGLSCVKIESIESDTADGPVINVLGADLMDRTPIYDIKPYIPYADCHPEATAGFTRDLEDQVLDIDFPQELQKGIPAETLKQIKEVLALDPRPRYQDHPDRTYGFQFAGYEIKFTVSAKEIPSTRQDGRDSMRSVLKVTSLQTM